MPVKQAVHIAGSPSDSPVCKMKRLYIFYGQSANRRMFQNADLKQMSAAKRYVVDRGLRMQYYNILLRQIVPLIPSGSIASSSSSVSLPSPATTTIFFFATRLGNHKEWGGDVIRFVHIERFIAP
jgi:hypothetical protein